MPGALVVGSRGGSEVQRGTGGAWEVVRVGDTLRPSDTVRTYDGEVDLTMNDIKVRVREGSEFAVRNIADSAIRARLRGRVESNVPEGKGSIEIESADSDAVVRTEGGHFTMLSDGRGVVAVGTVRGKVDFSAAGRSVSVGQGQTSVAVRGKAPTKPREALRQVLLAVEWPEVKETNRRTMELSGKVAAGSRVLVQGKAVEVLPDGGFTTQVSLRRGRQKVAVSAEDLLGRKRESSTSFLVDDSLPDVRMRERLWR
jgi:hypothetical protein